VIPKESPKQPEQGTQEAQVRLTSDELLSLKSLDEYTDLDWLETNQSEEPKPVKPTYLSQPQRRALIRRPEAKKGKSKLKKSMIKPATAAAVFSEHSLSDSPDRRLE